MNRAFGIVVTILWLLAMGVLVHRDVIPYWTAQDPPGGPEECGEYQIAIHSETHARVGTTWVKTSTLPTGTIVHSLTILNLDAISSVFPIKGELGLVTNLTYGPDRALLGFDFHLNGAGMPIQVNGYRYGSDFACTATFGDLTKTIPLDGRLSGYLGESLRPFTHLENLHVGQTWRIRLVDPFSLIQKQSLEFQTQLAKVTKRETIEHGGKMIECFCIETPSARAWADDDGRVLRQEVRIPLLGRWTLTDEPVDKAAYLASSPATKAANKKTSDNDQNPPDRNPSER